MRVAPSFEEAVLDVWEAAANGTLDALMRKWEIQRLEASLAGFQNDLRNAQGSVDRVKAEIARLKAIK